MRHTKRYLSVPLIAILLLSTAALGPFSCGPKQLGPVAEAVKDISGGTRDVIKAVGKAYDTKDASGNRLLTLEQKDKLADLLIAIARGGQKGVKVIEALQTQGVDTIPADRQKVLSLIFTDEVIAPFLQLLTEMGKLSEASSTAIRASLVGLRGAILLLSQRIGRNDIERLILQREGALHA